jgi:23S rRNA (cytosine1962-C5)-methyltransferase
MTQLFLKRGREASLQRFHPWIFSGAVARCDGRPADGDLVEVRAHDGTFLALGHYQAGSITVRVLSFRPCPIDAAFWDTALRRAHALRRAVIPPAGTTAYRLVHGEGDNLPGLVIDIYGNTAVLQAHTTGMFRARHAIAAALREILGTQLTAIYDKSAATLGGNSDSTLSGNDNRTLPGEAHSADGYLYRSGTPERIITEHGYRFTVDWEAGQKTGFFLDQRDNRRLLAHYAAGRAVLNLFCYTGAFSVYALGGGAARVDGVDSSQRAVECAQKNVALNFAPTAPHAVVAADAFDFLHHAPAAAYDLMVLDPPAFAKHRSALHNALQAYKRLNAAAFARIAPGGTVFTFSCSQVVSRTDFRNAIFSAAAIAGRPVRILHQLSQPADHPVNIFHPEGEYLKGLVLKVE